MVRSLTADLRLLTSDIINKSINYQTMCLEQKIMADLKTAMLAKDEAALRSLRAVKAAIILAKTSEGAGGEIKEEDEIKLLQKLVKQPERFAGNISAAKPRGPCKKRRRRNCRDRKIFTKTNVPR